MMINKVASYPIPGLKTFEVKRFNDHRGGFSSFTFDQLEGITGSRFVQVNRVWSEYNVLRGMHYQLKHPQGKLVMVEGGSIRDVVVDMRKSSPTFGMSISFDISGKSMLYVPPGLAHGYFVLSLPGAAVMYMVTEHYYPDDEHVLLFMPDDFDLEEEPIVSAKDIRGKLFKDCAYYD